MPLSDKEIKERYIAFRSDPANIQHNDLFFTDLNSISLDRLKRVIKENPDITKKIFDQPVTDIEVSTLLGLVTRLSYEKAFRDKIPVKSWEGLMNAIVNLLKQRGLESGRPTEIIKYEELEKKTPEELHAHIMSMLRRPFDRN